MKEAAHLARVWAGVTRHWTDVGLALAWGVSTAASLFPELGPYRFLVVVVGVVVVAVLYIGQRRQSTAVSRRYFHTLAEVLLRDCIEAVRQANPAIQELRGNIMLPAGSWRGP